MNILLVLGFTLNKDGSLSETLKNRLDAAIQEYNRDSSQQIIISGGKSIDAPAEYPTQASVMLRYLKEQGISETAIISDAKSHNTVQQLLMLRRAFPEDSISAPTGVTIIASECGFSDRVELLAKKVFDSRFSVRIVASAIPNELQNEFRESEQAAIKILKQYADKIKDGDWETVAKYEAQFQNGELKVKDYPAQK